MADLKDEENLPAAGDVSVVLDDADVPEDERTDILKEIETLVSESRNTKPLAQEYLRPQRSGVVFPIVINLLAAAAIAAGVYFISEYFRVREDSIALESRTYFSAEAQLIEEILKESQQRLEAKDQEINQIQTQLARLDEEKQSLEADMDSQIADREAELRAQLDAELQAERERLAGLGQSEDAISERLQEIEAQREQEFTSQLESFRAEAQAERDRLASELSARESQLQQTLEASQEERTRIAREAADREQKLREEYGARIEQLQQAGQEAQATISELQALRQQESLLADRVLGSFAVVVDDIQQGLSDDAVAGLDSLERLLRDQTAVDAESEKRRRTELALASTLRSLVQEVDVLRQNIAVRDLTTSEDEAAALEQQRAAELIRTAAGVVDLAEQAREAGKVNEARSLYQQALATIPSLEKVYPGILELEANRRRIVMATAMSDAQNLLAAGSSEAAITTYLTALQDVADSESDPLLELVTGIRKATEQNQAELLDAQQQIEDELKADLAARDQQISRINGQLLASRNSVSARDATISELRSQMDTLSGQLAARETSLGEASTELSQARGRITELEDQLATLQTNLQTAQTRSASLQDSLAAAQDHSADLEERGASLQTQVKTLTDEKTTVEQQLAALQEHLATLEEELANRPEVPVDTGQPSAATQAEIDALGAQVAALTDTVAAREATVEQQNTQLETLRDDLRQAQSDRDSLQTELEAANQQILGLQEQVANLRNQRDEVSGETSDLQTRVTQLTEEVQTLTAYRNQIQALTDRYDQSQAQALRLAAAGNYDTARDSLLAPLQSDVANQILPGLATNLDEVYSGLISQASARTSDEVRAATFEDVAGLTAQVKKNIDDPQGSAAVESYLRREPDIQPIADEIFEIIELASRDLSAAEVEYKLLGSVSRVTGNLVVVERLVAIAAAVGDTVEIRRTPQLGEEVPVALGTILEVTDRRVVVSVDQIYQLDTPPQLSDVVYLAQQ